VRLARSATIGRQFLAVAIALVLWGAAAVTGTQPDAGSRILEAPKSNPAQLKSQARNRASSLHGVNEGTYALITSPVLSYATYLGGSGLDIVTAVAVDSAGNLYVTGFTNSPDFPTSHAVQGNLGAGTCGSGLDTYQCFDAFVAKIEPSGMRLAYATYFGGSGEDYGAAIAVDAAGCAYITGYTNSTDLPTVRALQPRHGGGICGSAPNNSPCFDAFVAKLDPEGSSLVYSSYLGGSADDYGQGIAVDATGSVVISGVTASRDFPLSHALQDRFGGGNYDAFVTKLDPQGTALAFSTFLGGSGDDCGARIAVDSVGSAYATGSTNSPDFATPNAFQPDSAGGMCGASTSTFPCYDAYLTKLSPQGAIAYSTYLGGSGGDYAYGIAVDSSGSAYLTGRTTSVDFPVTWHALQTSGGGTSTDAFVTKLTPDGAAAVYSTYLGGLGAEAGLDIAVDAAGSAYVTGYAYGDGMPLVDPLEGASGGFFDAFLAQLNVAGEALELSTRLGGSGNDKAHGLAVDGRGNVYLAGETFSSDFPVTSATLQPGYAGGSFDTFLAKITTEPLPVLRLSTAQLNFPSQQIGTRSEATTVTMQNVGGGARVARRTEREWRFRRHGWMRCNPPTGRQLHARGDFCAHCPGESDRPGVHPKRRGRESLPPGPFRNRHRSFDQTFGKRTHLRRNHRRRLQHSPGHRTRERRERAPGTERYYDHRRLHAGERLHGRSAGGGQLHDPRDVRSVGGGTTERVSERHEPSAGRS
jgi:hypothetical protein